jgi:hypothetical protein
LEIQGSGTSRTLRISPAAGQKGDALVRVTVSDGDLSFERQFFLTVATEPVPWHNPVSAFDVNGDEEIAPDDALTIINWINANGAGPLAPPSSGNPPPAYLDVAPDNYVAPIDALYVINFINAGLAQAGAEGEAGLARNSGPENDEALLMLLAADFLNTSPKRRLST